LLISKEILNTFDKFRIFLKYQNSWKPVQCKPRTDGSIWRS